jgi:hypothetical protein
MKCGSAYHYFLDTTGVGDDKPEALKKSREHAVQAALDESDDQVCEPPCEGHPWVKVTPNPDVSPNYGGAGDGRVKVTASWRLDFRCFADAEWPPSKPSRANKPTRLA